VREAEVSLAKLFWHCHADTKRLSDDGIRAEWEPARGETALLFQTDTDVFRTQFNCEGAKVCDGLFLIKKPKGEPCLLFVELKGTDIDHAFTQLDAAIRVVVPTLEAGTTPRIRAIVVSDSPVASFRKKLAESGVPVQVIHCERRHRPDRERENGVVDLRAKVTI
jgi:acetyl-CoA carboxylase carboxyltransferase component